MTRAYSSSTFATRPSTSCIDDLALFSKRARPYPNPKRSCNALRSSGKRHSSRAPAHNPGCAPSGGLYAITWRRGRDGDGIADRNGAAVERHPDRHVTDEGDGLRMVFGIDDIVAEKKDCG